MRVGLLYMCKNQRDLRVRRFRRVLCFEEGGERGPVSRDELAQNSLRVSDSEHRPLIWLTRFEQPGSERNPYRKYPPDSRQ